MCSAYALDTCKKAEVWDEHGHEPSNQDLGISGHLRALMKFLLFSCQPHFSYESPNQLPGMSVLTKSVTDNLKNSWNIDLQLYISSSFHIWKAHEMSQIYPSDVKGRIYTFIPRRETFKADSTILPQCWSSDIPAIFWRSQHLDSKSLVSGKPQGNLKHCRLFTDQALLRL